MNWRDPDELAAYQEGYRVSLIPPDKRLPADRNSHPEGSSLHEAWEEGFGDATEDTIGWNRGEIE